MTRRESTGTPGKASHHRRGRQGNQHRNCKYELVHLPHLACRFSSYN